MSISSSFHIVIASKLPQFQFLIPNFSKTLISSISRKSKTKPFFSLSFHAPITFQRLTTKPQSMAAAAASSPSSSPSSPSSLPVEGYPPKLREIIDLFQSVQEPRAKYEQLLFYGQKLTPLDNKYKTQENKVEGCVSQVWVRATIDEDRNVWFEADSDAVITKGLAALLVLGLSGRPAIEILRVSGDFVSLLGIQQSLSPSRNNGFLNMLKLMQKKAVLLAVEAEKEAEKKEQEERPGSEVESRDSNPGPVSINAAVGLEANDGGGVSDNESLGNEVGSVESGSGGGGGLGSRGERIRERLERELKPIELVIQDISYQHAGHAGVRGRTDGETHFNLKVVSEEFEGKTLVKRHRMIYSLLQDELQNGLHALSIVAKTPAEVGAR